MFAVRMTYGAKAEYKSAGREPTDYANSKLIVMWGWSPGDGTFGTGTYQYLKWAKKQGVRIVCVDPRRTRSSLRAGRRAHVHPPVHRRRRADRDGLRDRQRGPARPGLLRPPRAGLRRGAPAAGRAGRRVVSLVPAGPRRRRAKTPEWAAAITGMPGRHHSPARHRVRHHQARRAAVRLRARAHRLRRAVPPRRLRARRHHRQRGHSRRQLGREQRRHRARGDRRPADRRQSDRRARGLAAARRPAGARQGRRLSGRHQADLFGGGRPLQPGARTSTRWWRALDGVEFFVAQDHFLTPTARYADIVLPATTFWERNDVHTPWAGAGHYAIFMRQAIEPMYECRNDIDIFADLARRVGIAGYNDRTEAGVAARADARTRSTTSTPSSTGASPGSPAPEDAVAFARRDSRARAPQVHDAVGQDRGLLHGARRQARPLRARRDPAHPDVDPADRRRIRAIRCSSARPSRGRGPTPFTATSRGPGAGRPRRRLAPPGRRRRARHRRRADACACSTTAGATVAAGAR